MVIDHRGLNCITILDRYPLPRVDYLPGKLQGAVCFTNLDLLSGYHQIRLQDEDVPKIAFRVPFGHYEFKVLPLRLTNAPATFQRKMNKVFPGHDEQSVPQPPLRIMKHFVHLALKCSGGISQPEGKNLEFIVTKGNSEGSFWNILILQIY